MPFCVVVTHADKLEDISSQDIESFTGGVKDFERFFVKAYSRSNVRDPSVEMPALRALGVCMDKVESSFPKLTCCRV